ncbi:MAG: hypothetical protein ISF22_07790 [Methanomassiliicoccus sp.]|nr:hypothetical protein [Methanomassiliicoccus sp.]
MTRGAAVAIVLMILLVALNVPVEAHVPEFPEGGESLEKAVRIEDPTKSWVVYSDLHGGGSPHYYLLTMKQGERLFVSLTVPQHYIERGFQPSMALIGPSIEDNGTLPSYVQVPEGSGAMVLTGPLPDRPEYEPFSPSAFYELGEIVLEAPQDGDYYIAVFDEGTGGNYALAVGSRESFTAKEWLLVPISSVSIYLWEGQDLLMVLAPSVLTFGVGLAAMLGTSRRRIQPVDVLWVLATGAGLLMLASAASFIYQMLWSLSQTGAEVTAAVTVIFAVLAIVLGLSALRVAHRERPMGKVPTSSRIILLAIGGFGLLLWAGWVIGPVIAIVTAVLPGGLLTRQLGRTRPARDAR